MKRLSFFFIAMFILLSINTFGQVYTGKIVMNGNPCPPPPDECPPGAVLWLETSSLDYVLIINSQWIWNDHFVFDGIEYQMNDEVEISGTVTVWQGREEYHGLEIETIKKAPTGIVSPSKSDNKVYYDAKNQVIVIDKTLQKPSIKLELYDRQGKAMLKKTNADTVSIAHLPTGVYVYCLLENNQAIYSGKILKN